MLCSFIIEYLNENLGFEVIKSHHLSGGSIHKAFLVQTQKGDFFIKTNNNPKALNMFQKEALGLQQLASTNTLRVPQVLSTGIAQTQAFLLLTYIPIGQNTNKASTLFGQQLARLHKQTAPQFGNDHNNYIGLLDQQNNHHNKWVDFYVQERLAPQFQLSIQQRLISPKLLNKLEKLYLKLPDILPENAPSLIHGDLWNGNYLIDENEIPVLIDPATCYADREMDLAMSRLFGGFSSEFYIAYEATFPLEKGWQERIKIYQLYYLTVHLNLFGKSYLSAVEDIVNSYVN